MQCNIAVIEALPSDISKLYTTHTCAFEGGNTVRIVRGEVCIRSYVLVSQTVLLADWYNSSDSGIKIVCSQRQIDRPLLLFFHFLFRFAHALPLLPPLFRFFFIQCCLVLLTYYFIVCTRNCNIHGKKSTDMVLNMVPRLPATTKTIMNNRTKKKIEKNWFMACEVEDLFGGYLEMGSSGSFFNAV